MSERLTPKTSSRVDAYLIRLLLPIEQGLGRVLPVTLVKISVEFLVFGVKQAWACLFGGLLLLAILLSAMFWPEGFEFNRYDGLFLFAVSVQILFLVSGLERLPEAKTIMIFHIVGTIMEVFKTSVGSWTYPEDAIFRISNVPLFSGFMYAAVGSYLARATRVFDLKFTNYPPIWVTLILSILIYVNFYSHHYIADIRFALFAASALVWGRCWVHFGVYRWSHKMPLLLGFVLISVFIWIAENIATLGRVWLYPSQIEGWQMVPLAKFGSWYLLMIVSFVLVTLTHKPKSVD